MKNIHIIPTDKPSRLWMTKLGNLSRCHDTNPIKKELGNNMNIYITSDEQIKEGDYVINNLDKLIGKSIRKLNSGEIKDREYSKIILTTDVDLIKDGVQSIDDEFLEWFVKNPSCESVEVIPLRKSSGWYDEKEVWHWDFLAYKIIIPQEEPKQERKIDTCHNFDIEIGCVKDKCRCEDEEPKQEKERGLIIKKSDGSIIKQETLEETAEEFLIRQGCQRMDCVGENCNFFEDVQPKDLIEFAKWQSERMYSEEDMIEFYLFCITELLSSKSSAKSPKELFEQFKKK
jgi:hypothetical protein